jgi:tetratricopeptide (TPR) repeat protein
MSFVAALLLLAADETRAVKVTCPVDGTAFTAELLTRTNRWGGIDRDFCPHAYRTFPMETKVWTCPGCRYSGTKEQFSVEGEKPVSLDAETARKVRDGLKPLRELPRRFAQRDVPAPVRFDLMAQSLQLTGRPPHEVGNAYLYAAWTARQRGARVLEYFDEYDELCRRYGLDASPVDLFAAKVTNRTDYDLAKAALIARDVEAGKFAGVNLLLARYAAAYLYRKHGENAEATVLIEAMRADAENNSVVKEALGAMTESIAQEQGFQRAAAARFEQALAEQKELAPAQRGDLLYQLGEIHRRLGKPEAAADYYRRALAQEGLGKETRAWAEETLQRIPKK